MTDKENEDLLAYILDGIEDPILNGYHTKYEKPLRLTPYKIGNDTFHIEITITKAKQ